MDLQDRLYDLIPILILGFLFRKYAAPHLVSDEREIVNKFLYNKDFSNVKPYLWIYIPMEQNSRKWVTFNERNSTNLNSPYVEYTLKTIVSQNQDFFNVCVINDDSLKELIPEWQHNIDLFDIHQKERLRELAKQKILYYYGGIVVPPSLLCLRGLRTLYVYSDVEPFKINCSHNENIYCCKKNNSTILEYSKHLQELIKDTSMELEFKNTINVTSDKYYRIIDNKYIGLVDKYNQKISLDKLLGQTTIFFEENIYGIYLPREEIVNNIKHKWFHSETVENICQGNIYIAKFFDK
tara:strand:+ start:1284 stop:2168 length:885 start_codon:yes stop_codon:yes gene_type:complete